MMMATQADEIKIGDRVQRRSGRQTIGVVERMFTPQYGKRERKATVRWLDSFATFGGGTRDNRSTVALTSLRRIEEMPERDVIAGDLIRRAFDRE